MQPGANNLGQYIPVAIPDTTTYPRALIIMRSGSSVSPQRETALRSSPYHTAGLSQTNTVDPNVSRFHNLGPLLIANESIPVRIKFTNNLPVGTGATSSFP